MNKGKYDVRRPIFWLVTVMAIAIVGDASLTFVRSGFLHPVRVVGTLFGLVAIWNVYFGIVRDLRAVHGEMADDLSIRVETSVVSLCILSYMLIAAVN